MADIAEARKLAARACSAICMETHPGRNSSRRVDISLTLRERFEALGGPLEPLVTACQAAVARIEKLNAPSFPIFESAGRVNFEEIRDLITGFEKERWQAIGTRVVKLNEGDVEQIVDIEVFRDPECDKRVAKIMAAAPRVLLTFDALHAECIASHKRETEANTKAQRVAWLESELSDLKLCYEALRQKTDAYAMAHEAREKHSESSRARSSEWEGEREMLNDAVGAALKALRELGGTRG